MPNFLRDARSWMGDVLQTSSGEEIVYQRGSSSVSMTANVGMGSTGASSGRGVQIQYEITDFVIRRSDLVIDGEVTFPKNGDVILCDSFEYIVVPDQEATKPYRRSGNSYDFIRISTKVKRSS